jgi:hypothetical protein
MIMKKNSLRCVVLLLLMSSHVANSAPFLDQSFFREGGGSLTSIINECCQYVAQTFAAGKTGKLESVRVDVQFSPEPETEALLRVSLWSTQSGVPLNSLSAVVLPSGTSLITDKVIFPTEVFMEKGTLYALLVDYVNAPEPGAHQSIGYWNGDIGDQYRGGESLAFYNDEDRWISQVNGYDVYFETYVSSVPIPGAIWLLFSGLLVLFGLKKNGTELS